MHSKKPLLKGPIIFLIILLLTIYAIVLRQKGFVWAEGTGFGDYIDPIGNFYRGKTLWDVLELIIVPVILAGGAWWLNRRDNRRNELVTAENTYDRIFEHYIDNISDLMLENNLVLARNWQQPSEKDAVQVPFPKTSVEVARIQTITALRSLDTKRRNMILQFIRDAKFSDFLLSGGNFKDIDLSRADLNSFNLSQSDFSRANLKNASIIKVNFRDANLSDVSFEEAKLYFTDFRDSRVQIEQFDNAEFVFDIKLPDGSLYSDGDYTIEQSTEIAERNH